MLRRNKLMSEFFELTAIMDEAGSDSVAYCLGIGDQLRLNAEIATCDDKLQLIMDFDKLLSI